MQIRTDLAMESRALTPDLTGVTTQKRKWGNIEEIRVVIQTEAASRALEKPKGTYITLYLRQLACAPGADRQAMSRALARAVRPMLPPEGEILVIGLGNRRMTADALGSAVTDQLLVTRHLKQGAPDALINRMRSVCSLTPGVLGVTGMESAEVVKGIVERIHPAAIIAIDALAARESSRICTTIQITDTGIRPGSGVGNHRTGLAMDTLGVPVLAIGVPMVVYASLIARDALSLLIQDMGMPEEEHAQAIDALVEKVTRQGLGELVVTPREVDEWVGRVARIIADGLNIALHPGLNEEEIQWLSHDEA